MNQRVPATLDNTMVMFADIPVTMGAVGEWVDERHGEYGVERGVGGGRDIQVNGKEV